MDEIGFVLPGTVYPIVLRTVSTPPKSGSRAKTDKTKPNFAHQPDDSMVAITPEDLAFTISEYKSLLVCFAAVGQLQPGHAVSLLLAETSNTLSRRATGNTFSHMPRVVSVDCSVCGPGGGSAYDPQPVGAKCQISFICEQVWRVNEYPTMMAFMDGELVGRDLVMDVDSLATYMKTLPSSDAGLREPLGLLGNQLYSKGKALHENKRNSEAAALYKEAMVRFVCGGTFLSGDHFHFILHPYLNDTRPPSCKGLATEQGRRHKREFIRAVCELQSG
jgi:hypothetical protein